MVDVALNCGFAGQSHVTREFHRYFGCTPREYRDRYAGVRAGSMTKSAGHSQ